MQNFAFLIFLFTSTYVFSNTYKSVKPILDKRCVVCHGCYTSPCNLKLDSYFGALRGASKENIYANRIFKSLRPNRVLQDQIHHTDWQKAPYNFSNVLFNSGNEHDNLENSIMYQMLKFRNSEKSDKKFVYKPGSSRSCVSSKKEFNKYKKKHNSLAGMPYGMQKLSENEYESLKSWIAQGSAGPSYKDLNHLEGINPEHKNIVKKWESWLNKNDNKSQLISRYIFEHFYAANIYFDTEKRVFYRLVRSSTPFPKKIKEVATRRPYDSPGETVFYRFKKVIESVVHKNHIPLDMSVKRFDKISKLFYSKNWKGPKKMPSYKAKTASNPFITFQSIPSKIRYKFFLEHSYFFVRSFIHGPVCNGQVATNVIRDHFWVFFMDPDKDPTVQNETFLKQQMKNLDLPAKNKAVSFFRALKFKFNKYQKSFSKLMAKSFEGGFDENALWNGEGVNKNAILTVYRHYKSANVFYGAQGSIPKTAWILNYPIFERIYYDLVAGFDVWSPVSHKIGTRRYMDLLRMESEDLFLGLFNENARKKLRKSWNKKFGSIKRGVNKYKLNGLNSEQHSALNEVVGKVFGRFPSKIINQQPLSKDPLLQELVGKKLFANRFFPEVTLLKVIKPNGESNAYTIFANKDRPYVNHMFFEPKNPENDVLNIINGVNISYAYSFLVVKQEELPGFIKQIKSVQEEADWLNFKNKFHVDRLDSKFWETSDYFQDESVRLNPVTGGIIDLSRYL